MEIIARIPFENTTDKYVRPIVLLVHIILKQPLVNENLSTKDNEQYNKPKEYICIKKPTVPQTLQEHSSYYNLLNLVAGKAFNFLVILSLS